MDFTNYVVNFNTGTSAWSIFPTKFAIFLEMFVIDYKPTSHLYSSWFVWRFVTKSNNLDARPNFQCTGNFSLIYTCLDCHNENSPYRWFFRRIRYFRSSPFHVHAIVLVIWRGHVLPMWWRSGRIVTAAPRTRWRADGIAETRTEHLRLCRAGCGHWI